MQIHPAWNTTDRRRRRADMERRTLERIRDRGLPAVDPCDRLTVRQLTALRLLASGLTVEEAAERLGIGRRSLNELLRFAYQRLGITGTGQGKAARACYVLGLADGGHQC